MIEPDFRGPGKPRVFDCFIFSNELDLLEIRLNELARAVDVFVLVEAPWTFRGTPKPLHYRDNRARFAQFNARIRHVIVEDMPHGSSQADYWRREFHQRNQLARALTDVNADDRIMLSDVDEIPRAASVQAVVAYGERWPAVHCFELTMYRYFLDFRRQEPWIRNGPRMVRSGNLRSFQKLRDVRAPDGNLARSAWRWMCASYQNGKPLRRIVHRDAGWHFSSMGGIDALATKISSYSHVLKASGPDDRNARKAAADLIEAGRSRPDLMRVPIDDSYPHFLRCNLLRFSHLISSSDCIHS